MSIYVLDPYRFGDAETFELRRHISALDVGLCHEIAGQPIKILFREGSVAEILSPPESEFRRQTLALKASLAEELRRYEGRKR